MKYQISIIAYFILAMKISIADIIIMEVVTVLYILKGVITFVVSTKRGGRVLLCGVLLALLAPFGRNNERSLTSWVPLLVDKFR